MAFVISGELKLFAVLGYIYYRSSHLRSVQQQKVEHMVAWILLDCSVSRLLTWHKQEITQWSPDRFFLWEGGVWACN